MKSYEYIISTDKYNIDYINKIVEAYEGLAIVRTLDQKNGIIKILTNTYFKDDVDKLILKLRKYDIKIDIIEEGIWKGVL